MKQRIVTAQNKEALKEIYTVEVMGMNREQLKVLKELVRDKVREVLREEVREETRKQES